MCWCEGGSHVRARGWCLLVCGYVHYTCMAVVGMWLWWCVGGTWWRVVCKGVERSASGVWSTWVVLEVVVGTCVCWWSNKNSITMKKTFFACGDGCVVCDSKPSP